MALSTFQGDTHIIGITLTVNGTVIDPAVVNNVLARLINRLSGETLQAWSILPIDGYDAIVINPPDKRCFCYVGEDVTMKANLGFCELQVEIITLNDDMPDGFERQTEKCVLLELNSAEHGTL